MTERNEYLKSIHSMLETGDTTGAVSRLLETVAALMDEVDILNVQMETLLETLAQDETDYDEDECSSIVTCSQCGCVMEVEAYLLEDEDAELSCPQCSAILEV